MSNLNIGISEWNVGKAPDVLVTYALGSCVGICLFDKKLLIGGLAHIMLPDSTNISDSTTLNRMKFADTAIPDMFNKLVSMGAFPARMTAKIAGGALMFSISNDRFNIGERNVAAVKAALAKLKIPISGQDTGQNYGRTLFFHTETGTVEVKSTVRGVKTI